MLIMVRSASACASAGWPSSSKRRISGTDLDASGLLRSRLSPDHTVSSFNCRCSLRTSPKTIAARRPLPIGRACTHCAAACRYQSLRALSSCAWHRPENPYAPSTQRSSRVEVAYTPFRGYLPLNSRTVMELAGTVRVNSVPRPVTSAVTGSTSTASLTWLFLPGGLNYGIKCRLGFAVPIEQQRIVRAAADGKIVLPRITIGDAPEGDARHNVGVLDEDGE